MACEGGATIRSGAMKCCLTVGLSRRHARLVFGRCHSGVACYNPGPVLARGTSDCQRGKFLAKRGGSRLLALVWGGRISSINSVRKGEPQLERSRVDGATKAVENDCKLFRGS